jgi:hypothetical protein
MGQAYRLVLVLLPWSKESSEAVMIISTADDNARPRVNSHWKASKS